VPPERPLARHDTKRIERWAELTAAYARYASHQPSRPQPASTYEEALAALEREADYARQTREFKQYIAARQTPFDEPSWHGTDSGYRRHKCRCPGCRQAHTEARRKERGGVAKARIREARRYLKEQTGLKPGGITDFENATVGDLIQARQATTPDRCWFSRPHMLKDQSANQILYVMFRCMQGRCIQCADRWAMRAATRWLKTWEDADVWRIEVSPEDLKGAWGRRLREAYGGDEKVYAGAWHRSRGRLVIFAPGEIEGGERVANVGRAIAEALCETPAYPRDAERKGRNRTFGIPITKRTKSERFVSLQKGRLAKLTEPEIQALADKVAEALGKRFMPEDEPWSVANFMGAIRDLTDDDMRLVEAVVEEYSADLAAYDDLYDRLQQTA
jgi:hypothetical protein